MTREKERPIRTCVGCRSKKNSDQMVRYTLSEGGFLAMDSDTKSPGRGAYSCMNPQCLKKALKKNTFSRSFKRRIRVDDPDAMLEALAGRAKNRIPWISNLVEKA